MMRIRFGDTGETYQIIGERRQFWLFDKNGETGRAVKGSDAYEILDGDADYPVEGSAGIEIRDNILEDSDD